MMRVKKSMEMVLMTLFISVGMSLNAQSITTRISTLEQDAVLVNGVLAVHAVRASDGSVVASRNPDTWVAPASNLKLLTTYAAVDLLGADHRFTTVVGRRGEVNDGILMGDLVILAGGDPTLGSRFFAETHGDDEDLLRKIVNALSQEGIRGVRGRLIVDESIYDGPDIAKGYSWEDIGNYYAASASALTFGDNRYSVFLNSGAKAGEVCSISKIEPSMGQRVACETKAAAIGNDQAYFYLESDGPVLRGEIPLNKTDFEVKGAIADPAKYFVARLMEVLQGSGVTVDQQVMATEGTVLPILQLQSPTLIEIVGHTNMKSDNLYADHLLRQIGALDGGDGSFDEGVARLKRWMVAKGIPTKGLKMQDGSGLSTADRVTARMMCEVMSSLRKEEYYKASEADQGFMKSLPVAGRSGSMRRIGKGTVIDGKMRAKTGYIDGVRSYTGAVVSTSGEVIVFSIIANDYDCSATEMRKRLTKLMVALGG